MLLTLGAAYLECTLLAHPNIPALELGVEPRLCVDHVA